MKKKTKVIDGKLTVIRKPKRRSQAPRDSVEIIDEAIGAIHGAVRAGVIAHRVVTEAGHRVCRVINKIRGK